MTDVLRLPEIHLGDLDVWPVEMAVTWRSLPIRLSRDRLRLLHLLTARPGRLASRSQILDYLYGEENDAPLDRSVDSMIRHLRRCFEKADPEFDRIVTFYGVGYRWQS